MKNYEKYAEEIKKWDKGHHFCDEFIEPNILKPLGKVCEVTSCELCDALMLMWLLEEYEEPKEPEVDWSKVEVDTPILVRNDEDEEWVKRHFAKYENGKVYAWHCGGTSWAEGCICVGMTSWKLAKLAESGEE